MQTWNQTQNMQPYLISLIQTKDPFLQKSNKKYL